MVARFRPSRRATLLAPAVAVLVSGCAGWPVARLPDRPGGTFPAEASGVAPALAGATEVEARVVDLPALSTWPRTLRAEGPFYGLLQLIPYVGQFGMPSDEERADAGMGFGAVFGYRMPLAGARSLGIELIYERSGHHNARSDVDASATRLVAGLRASFHMDEKLVPFGVVGAGSYKLEFSGLDPRFDLSGMGIMFGGGVDYAFSRRLHARAELGLHIWDAAEESGSGGAAETLTIGLGIAASF